MKHSAVGEGLVNVTFRDLKVNIKVECIALHIHYCKCTIGWLLCFSFDISVYL